MPAAHSTRAGPALRCGGSCCSPELPVSDSEGIVLQLHLPRQTPHRLRGAEMTVPMHISEGECLSVINNLSVFQLYVEAGLLLE